YITGNRSPRVFFQGAGHIQGDLDQHCEQKRIVYDVNTNTWNNLTDIDPFWDAYMKARSGNGHTYNKLALDPARRLWFVGHGGAFELRVANIDHVSPTGITANDWSTYSVLHDDISVGGFAAFPEANGLILAGGISGLV